MCGYELGWCYYLLSEWEQCITQLRAFLRDYRSPSFRAYAGYQLAYSLELTGKRQEARDVMLSVPGWTRKQVCSGVCGGERPPVLDCM